MSFTINTSLLAKRLDKAKQIRADTFEPELRQFTGLSLADAARLTPKRPAALIETAQKAQYRNRINNIPSSHTLEDPSLIVEEDGTHLLYLSGKWFNATRWTLTGAALAAYTMLNSERQRRMQVSQGKFINDRKQARTLYAKQWVEAGHSLGLPVSASNEVTAAVTRRKPAKAPPRGYGQRRGGKNVLTYVIYTPLIGIPSRYKTFTAREIITAAEARNRKAYNVSLEKHLKREVARI